MDTAAALLIAGSLVFGVGAWIGVPGVFMLSDPDARLDLLQRRLAYWRVAQPLYCIGPLIAAAGTALLATTTSDNLAVGLFVLAALVMVGGIVAWSYDCFLRGVHPVEFVRGTLPGWPFAVYVPATIAGIALTAAGFAAAGHSGRLWASMLVADAGFLAFYVITKDIPPFFFYTLLLLVGAVLLAGIGA